MPRISMEKANIRQNVALYEGALKRHGQFMRWYSSLVCYCIDDMGRSDPSCNKCLGRGYIYSPVSSVKRIDSGMSLGSIFITVKANIRSINRVYDNRNNDLSYSNFSGNTIELDTVLKEGRMYHVDYEEELEVNYNGSATYLERGLVRVPIVGESNLYGNFIGELTEVTSMINESKNNLEMNILSFWEDLILTDSNADIGDTITVIAKYVKPLMFLISGINQKLRYEVSYVASEADAQLTVPGYYYIGVGDLVTLLKAEQKASIAGNSNGSEFHRLPFFHVKTIISIIDEYGEINDAVIVRNNEIKWGSRVPGKFSINLTYNPTFSVLPDLPTMRYAENKVFPRRVLLKQWDMGSRGNKRPSAIGMGLNQGELIY